MRWTSCLTVKCSDGKLKCVSTCFRNRFPLSCSEKVCHRRDVTAVPEFRWGEGKGRARVNNTRVPREQFVVILSHLRPNDYLLTFHSGESATLRVFAEETRFNLQLLVSRPRTDLSNFLVHHRYVSFFSIVFGRFLTWIICNWITRLYILWTIKHGV